MASAGMTPAQIAHYQEMPIWMIAVWTIGVWGAMLGSVLILLRNKLAFPVFAVSLAAFLVSLIYTYVLTDGGEIMGATDGDYERRHHGAAAFLHVVFVADDEAERAPLGGGLTIRRSTRPHKGAMPGIMRHRLGP